MAPHRRLDVERLWPAACGLLLLAACTPTPQVAIGPQPAPCTDSVAARVARMPAESVTVADREHALWAQAQCRLALDSAERAAQQTAVAQASGSGARGAASAAATWPPPACEDSIAQRVARLPADSVSAADREHARAAREECERALAAPPPPAGNPASANPTAALLLGAALIVLLVFVL